MLEVCELRGNMWLWGVDQLVLWVSYNRKSIQQHFMLHICDTTNIGIQLGFYMQITHIE